MSESTSYLNAYRQQDRPTYYEPTSNSLVTISYDFETYLILLDASTKQSLISRLRNTLQASNGTADRDNLELAAVTYESAAQSAIMSDLALDIGDYASFSKTELQNQNLPEISSLVTSIGSSMTSTVFQNAQARSELNMTSIIQNGIEQKTSAATQKQQLESWINVIITYLTPS